MAMRFSARLAVLASVTVVAGLVALFPARVAYSWLAPPDLALSGIGGSVWDGSAAEASIRGLYVRDLRWQFRPGLLLRGGIFFTLQAVPPGGFLEGTAGVTASGAVSLTDLRASTPLDEIHRLLPVPAVSGKANVRLERLTIKQGLPTVADGFIEIENLVASWVNRQPLGAFRLELRTQASGIVGTLEGIGALVDVAGSAELRSDRRWEVVALLAANQRTPVEMRQQLAFVGPANARGQYEFRRNGQL